MSLYLIIMGVQGAGKGTQAAFVKEQFGIPHISTGDLFRAMKTREDELARRVQDIMRAGQLVSDETTNEVLQDRLQQADAANGVILDGYPRNIDQAQWLDDYLNSKGETLTAVLLLELDLYTAFKRAFGRVSTEDKKKSYNIYYNSGEVEWCFKDHPEEAYPPRLEATLKATGEKLVRRPDDEAGGVVKRIDTYLDTTTPLIDYYRSKGLLIEIDADQPIEAVSRDIRNAIERVRQ